MGMQTHGTMEDKGKEDMVLRAKPIVHGLRLLGAAVVLGCLLLAGCAGANNSSQFIGTWDLQSGQSGDGNENLSAENVSAMRQLGLDAYLNLDSSGTLSLVTFDEAKRGDWKATGDAAANATVEGQSATIALTGDTLQLKQKDTVLVFTRGDPREPISGSAASSDAAQDAADSAGGLSEMVVRGALFEEPTILIDDEVCTFAVNGSGADKLGDPGFNLQITNNRSTPIDVWVKDPFIVGGAAVRVYLCETVGPGETVTAFMQFDTDDVGSTNPSALEDAEGTVLVDDDEHETIGTYRFAL